MTRTAKALAIAGLPALLLLAGCAQPATTGAREPDASSRLRVAAAAEASGQADMALSLYAAAAAAEPARAEVQARFAAALARSGNLAQAEQVLTRALQRRPDDPGLLVQLGRLRLRSGAAEQAHALFERVLATAPRQPDALGGRGVAFDLMGLHAEAERDHRAALAEAPGSVVIANNLALSLLLAGRAGDAAAILEPLARLPAAPPRVVANLAVARMASGDQEGARALLARQFGTADPDRMLTALASALSGHLAGRS